VLPNLLKKLKRHELVIASLEQLSKDLNLVTRIYASQPANLCSLGTPFYYPDSSEILSRYSKFSHQRNGIVFFSSVRMQFTHFSDSVCGKVLLLSLTPTES
jgi:hypothetical protein